MRIELRPIVIGTVLALAPAAASADEVAPPRGG